MAKVPGPIWPQFSDISSTPVEVLTVALKFTLRIEDRCQSIGDAPRGGRSRDDIVPGLRTVPFEHSALVAYIIDDAVVRIVNIFYGGRDYETLMRDGGSSAPS